MVAAEVIGALDDPPVCALPKLPSSSFDLPNAVWSPIRFSSELSCVISDWAAVLAAVSVAPPLAVCTARSRMRCRIEVTSFRAPSAVCATLMPSWVLRTATFMPPICERRPSEIERPAASSAARLMRKPLDSFSRDFDIWLSVTDRFRYAFWAAMFWLMRRPMSVFLLEWGLYRPVHEPWRYANPFGRAPRAMSSLRNFLVLFRQTPI